jgi:hypothetical protein
MANSSLHITDLFFQAEISQAVGSDASEAWLLEQTSLGARKRSHSPMSATQSPPRRCSETSCINHRAGQSQSSMASCQIKASPMESQLQLESEIENIRLLLDENSRLYIGLLYTDAAHTVLHRFGRLNRN